MDLSYELLGNPLTAWITALGIALAINLMVGIAKMAIMHHLSAIVGRTDTELDDSILEVVRKTSQALILFVTLLVGTRYLALPERVDLIIRGAATIAVFTQLGLWAGAGLDFWLSRYKTRAMASDAGAGTATGLAAMSFLGRLFLWALVLLLALDNLGVDVTAMVAGLGVGGIAVALAVQNILGDLFASLSIVVDKPFVIGDFIIVDAYMGKVEHVGLKTTRVRSLGGEELVFANSDLLSARVRNFKRMRERRILFR
ncbi:MAG: mechanosensitive ion channel family protein, partial [Panacagrimonas sp.]